MWVLRTFIKWTNVGAYGVWVFYGGWMEQVKTMRVLQYFPTIDDPSTRKSLLDVSYLYAVSSSVQFLKLLLVCVFVGAGLVGQSWLNCVFSDFLRHVFEQWSCYLLYKAECVSVVLSKSCHDCHMLTIFLCSKFPISKYLRSERNVHQALPVMASLSGIVKALLKFLCFM
jgi:hypothetical protein